MATKTISLLQRRVTEAQRELKIKTALCSTKHKLQAAQRENKRKIKTVDELLGMLCIDDYLLKNRILRDRYGYAAKSCNLERQVYGLIDHLFVKYAAPRFFYNVFRSNRSNRFDSLKGLFQGWFVAVAQGESFAKLTQGVLTKREAHLLLVTSRGGHAHELVWRAKLLAANIPGARCDVLIENLFTRHWIDDIDGRMANAITFYANNHNAIPERHLEQTCRFIASAYFYNPDFDLLGRSASSLLKMTKEWSNYMHFEGIDTSLTWSGTGWRNWSHCCAGWMYDVQELCDASSLLLEGRHQRHCVTTYLSSCQNQSSAIFSMRVSLAHFTGCYDQSGLRVYHRDHEVERLTIEVDPKQKEVVQIKGRNNRYATEQEKRIITLWMRSLRLSFSEWCDY